MFAIIPIQPLIRRRRSIIIILVVIAMVVVVVVVASEADGVLEWHNAAWVGNRGRARKWKDKVKDKRTRLHINKHLASFLGMWVGVVVRRTGRHEFQKVIKFQLGGVYLTKTQF